MSTRTTYRGFFYHYWPPPVSSRVFDWHWEDGDGEFGGDAASEQEIREAIDEHIEKYGCRNDDCEGGYIHGNEWVRCLDCNAEDAK